MLISSNRAHNTLSALLAAFPDAQDILLESFSVVDAAEKFSDTLILLEDAKEVTVLEDPADKDSYLVYFDSEARCLRHLDALGKKLTKRFSEII